MDAQPRDLRRLAAAVGLSALGDMLALITLVLGVHELTGSGLAVSALFATTLIPVVALAPLAGALVDRTESVRVLLLASLVQAGATLALAFGTHSLGMILGLSAVISAGAAVSLPAEAAVVQAAAGAEHLARANGLTETARYLGFGLAPLAAAGLTAVVEARGSLLVNAATFGAMALAASSLRTRRPPARRDTPGISSSALAGISLLRGDGVLRVTVGSGVIALAILSITLTADIFYCKDVLGVGDGLYALLTGAWMLGMVLGASRFAPRVRPEHLAPAALMGLAVQGSGIAAQVAFATVPAAAIGFFMGGAGHGAKNALLRTLIAHRTPEPAHGRVFASYNAACNAAELLAIAAGGLLVSLIGPSLSLVLAGSAAVLVAAFGLSALHFLRRPLSAASGRLQPET